VLLLFVVAKEVVELCRSKAVALFGVAGAQKSSIQFYRSVAVSNSNLVLFAFQEVWEPNEARVLTEVSATLKNMFTLKFRPH
jgi:hypothetical protein